MDILSWFSYHYEKNREPGCFFDLSDAEWSQENKRFARHLIDYLDSP